MKCLILLLLSGCAASTICSSYTIEVHGMTTSYLGCDDGYEVTDPSCDNGEPPEPVQSPYRWRFKCNGDGKATCVRLCQ